MGVIKSFYFFLLLWFGAATGRDSGIPSRRFSRKETYRPWYHITEPRGWINDPCGFLYFKDRYHVFYQYHPNNGMWGHIQWGHAASENLVDWVHYPPALVPSEHYDEHGCLGGSALNLNKYMVVYYTGNVVVNNNTKQSQNIAISRDGVAFQRYSYNPIIKKSPFASGAGSFKNPKVWLYSGSWYMLLGARSTNNRAQLLLYVSSDMFKWKLSGVIAQSYGDMGHMWENPDLFDLDEEHILVLSVRGILSAGYRYKNLYQTGYVVGKFDYTSARFSDSFELSTETFNELDHGHDFYAAKTLRAPDGRTLLIAWLGMWESAYQEPQYGWASMLTIVRQLTLSRRGTILMNPVTEMEELRKEVLDDAWYKPGESFTTDSSSFEMVVNSTDEGANNAVLYFEWKSKERFKMWYSAKRGVMSIDRGGPDGKRNAYWSPDGDKVYWRLFVDQSSVELFCGAGEVVFSSRIYPKNTILVRIGGDTDLHIVSYRLRRSRGLKNRVRQEQYNRLRH